MWKTLDEKTLKSKKVVELREIAKTFGLQGYEKIPKKKTVTKTITISLFIAGNRSRATTTNHGNPVKAGNLATTAKAVKVTNRGNHAKPVKAMNRGYLTKAANHAKTAKTVTTAKAANHANHVKTATTVSK